MHNIVNEQKKKIAEKLGVDTESFKSQPNKPTSHSQALDRDTKTYNEKSNSMLKSSRLSKNQNGRSDSFPGSREDQINEIRAEAKEKSQKEVEKAMKDVHSKSGKAVLKLAGDHMDKLAYAIANKMAKEANRGGMHAVFPILLTFFIAFLKDLSDVTGVGAVLGILTGIIAGTIIAIFWIQVSGGWKGGYVQRKLIKKIIIKTGLAAFIETLPGPNLVPTFIIINLWSYLDWAKDIKKSKARLEDFTNNYKVTRNIHKNTIKRYGSKI